MRETRERKIGRIDAHGLTGKQLAGLVDDVDDFVRDAYEDRTIVEVQVLVTVTLNGGKDAT